MRKQLLICLVILLCISTSFTSLRPIAKHTSKPVASGEFNIQDWLIDKATADKMVENYNHHKGKPSKKQMHNSAVRDYIIANYVLLGEQRRLGQYSDEDVDRYRKARNISPADGKGNVSGYSTEIVEYKVIAKSGFLIPAVTYLYADDCTICPPPDSPPCD